MIHDILGLIDRLVIEGLVEVVLRRRVINCDKRHRDIRKMQVKFLITDMYLFDILGLSSRIARR